MIAERIILLALVLILNALQDKKSYANHLHHVLTSNLRKVKTEKLPKRLAGLISEILIIKNNQQLLEYLTVFLQDQRGESLYSCNWHDRKSPILQTTKVEPSSIEPFATTPLQDLNMDMSQVSMREDDAKFEEADEIERMELKRQAEEKQRQLAEEEERRKNASMVIFRFLRNSVVKISNQRKKPYYEYEEAWMFAPYGLSPNRCGICGIELVTGGVEEGREATTEVETKESHENSEKHQTAVEQFNAYKMNYKTKVYNSLKEISIFMAAYQVSKENTIYSTSNIAVDVNKLTEQFSAFDINLKKMMSGRNWDRHAIVFSTFTMMKSTYQKCSGMIKRHFEDYQKKDLARQASVEQGETMMEEFQEGGAMDFTSNNESVNDYHNNRGRKSRRGHSKGHGHRGNRGRD